MDIVQRLRFDSVRCEMQFSKGVAGNIEEAAAEIERLRAALKPFTWMPLAKPEDDDDNIALLVRGGGRSVRNEDIKRARDLCRDHEQTARDTDCIGEDGDQSGSHSGFRHK